MAEAPFVPNAGTVAQRSRPVLIFVFWVSSVNGKGSLCARKRYCRENEAA
jgi:hypothetical protein